MRTPRHLSYFGTATLLTALGILSGCTSDLGDDGPGITDPNDIDGDGIPNAQDPDIDGDGISNDVDDDDDNDGIKDVDDSTIDPIGTGGTTGSGGGAATGGAGSGGGPSTVKTCTPGIATSSQVPRLRNAEYDNIVRDLLGVTAITSNDGLPPSAQLSPDYTGEMDNYAWNNYQLSADAIATQFMAGADKTKFMSCDPAADANCYKSTIETFGRKIFRRPLTQAEVDSFMTLTTLASTPAPTPAEVSEAILYAFLVSPSFIMTPELSPEMEGAAHKLTSHEVATRLSLLIWGSVGDDILNQAADNNLLQTPAQILEQAERMIAMREKSGPQMVAAHRAYVNMHEGHWWERGVTHDVTKYPAYTPAAVAAMKQEVDMFFEDTVFNGGSFKQLFLSNVGFVNKDTAPIYGLDPASFTETLQKVTFDNPAQPRPGIMTRAGFLSSYSSPAATSPILRGAFAAVWVLGVDPGAPDPTAAAAGIPDGQFTTRRQQVTEGTKNLPCSGCHTTVVNPPGFVLENYDAIGAWQTVDPLGGQIDPVAGIPISLTETKPINNPQELMQYIADNAEARRRYVERLIAFGTKRFPNEQDACIVNDLDTKMASDGYTALDVYTDLTQADSFRLRTVGN